MPSTDDYNWAAVVRPGVRYRAKDGRKLIVDKIVGAHAVMLNFNITRGSVRVSRIRIDRLNPKDGYTPIGTLPPLKRSV